MATSQVSSIRRLASLQGIARAFAVTAALAYWDRGRLARRERAALATSRTTPLN